MAICQLLRRVGFSYLLLFSLTSFATEDQSEIIEDLEYELEDLIKQIEEKNNSFKINGFLSAGLAYSDSHVPIESIDLDNDYNFAPEAVLGLQLEFNLDEKSKVVTQLIGRGKFDFDIIAEWAYFAYKLTPALTLRAGRVRIPLFLLSDYLEVGYAYPWVRPPSEVYDVAELFSSQDGMDVLYNFSAKGIDTQLQLGGGTLARTSPSYGGLEFKARNMITASTKSNYKSWTLNANIAGLEFVADTEGTTLGNVNDDLEVTGAGEIKFDHLGITYMSLGVSYDDGTWLLQAEATQVDYEDRPGPQIFPFTRSHYVSVARRFGRITPYILYSKNRSVGAAERQEAMAIYTEAILSGTVVSDPLNTLGLLALLDHTQASVALGFSYSLSAKAVMKFEWKRIGKTKGTVGEFEDFAAYTSILLEQDALDGTNVYNLVFDIVF